MNSKDINSSVRNSFVFYRSYADCIKELPEEYRTKVMYAIMDYGLDNKLPDDKDPILKAIMISIIPSIDNSNRRYEIAKANGMKGKEFGFLGGRPKNSVIEKIPVLKKQGCSPQKISEELGISLKTVYKYLNEES